MTFPGDFILDEIACILATSSSIANGETCSLKISPVSRVLSISYHIFCELAEPIPFLVRAIFLLNGDSLNSHSLILHNGVLSASEILLIIPTGLKCHHSHIRFIIMTKSFIHHPNTSSILPTHRLDMLSLDVTSKSVVIYLI